MIAHAGAPALRIELTGTRYTTMVLSTEDPGRLAARLRDRGTSVQEMVVESDGERPAGTLRLPADHLPPAPAVLLLPGSGPLDRDSDHTRARIGVARLLADELAAGGPSTYRRQTGAPLADDVVAQVVGFVRRVTGGSAAG